MLVGTRLTGTVRCFDQHEEHKVRAQYNSYFHVIINWVYFYAHSLYISSDNKGFVQIKFEALI